MRSLWAKPIAEADPQWSDLSPHCFSDFPFAARWEYRGRRRATVVTQRRFLGRSGRRGKQMAVLVEKVLPGPKE